MHWAVQILVVGLEDARFTGEIGAERDLREGDVVHIVDSRVHPADVVADGLLARGEAEPL